MTVLRFSPASSGLFSGQILNTISIQIYIRYLYLMAQLHAQHSPRNNVQIRHHVLYTITQPLSRSKYYQTQSLYQYRLYIGQKIRVHRYTSTISPRSSSISTLVWQVHSFHHCFNAQLLNNAVYSTLVFTKKRAVALHGVHS